MSLKYKKGDKVRIVGFRHENMNCNGYMDEYLDTIMTIVCPREGYFGEPVSTYVMEEDDGEWYWTDEMIDHKRTRQFAQVKGV